MNVVSLKKARSMPKVGDTVQSALRMILKDQHNPVSKEQESLAEYLAEMAEEEGGIFIEEDGMVSFGSETNEVVVYGSLDQKNVPHFQAIYRTSKPTTFTVSEVFKGYGTGFKGCLLDLQAKLA